MISRKLVVLLTVFVFLNVLDVYTTVLILQLGGKETNSFWLRFNDSGITEVDIMIKSSLVALSVFIISLLHWRSLEEESKLGFAAVYIITIGLVVFYCFVVVNNIRMLNFQIEEVQRKLGCI